MHRPCRDDLSQAGLALIRVVPSQVRCSNSIPRPPKPVETINLRKRPVRARTAAQDSYIRVAAPRNGVRRRPAGTGKTWLAVSMPRNCSNARKSIASSQMRPAVEAGERSASCPATCGKSRSLPEADLRRAVRFGFCASSNARCSRRDRDAPLAFMRGRTLTNAVIILTKRRTPLRCR